VERGGEPTEIVRIREPGGQPALDVLDELVRPGALVALIPTPPTAVAGPWPRATRMPGSNGSG
jgi:hypothetical protein